MIGRPFRGPRIVPPSWGAGRGGSGATLPGWLLLSDLVSSIDQGSGASVAPFDPGGIGDTGTGYNANTGRISVVCASHTVAVDGYREELLRWTVPINTIWDDYDPEVDQIDVGLDLISFPGAVNGMSLFAGIGDRGTSEIATLNGVFFGLRQASLTSHQAESFAATARNGTNGLLLCDEGRMHFVGYPSQGPGYTFAGFSRFEETSSPDEDEFGVDVGASPAELQTDTTEHRLHFGVAHAATTDLAGKTATADLYLRRRRTTGRPFS